jgi:DNA-binding NarL/FixJ family response regulator
VRVLIVERSARIRVRLAERLAPGAVEIVEAESLTEAMAAVRTAPPDAVLVDVHLDAGVGISGLKRLRAAASGATIVVLTNDVSELQRRECLRHGADHFFDKSREFDRAVELVLAKAADRP